MLTDGNTGVEFLKEIVYRYLELKYPYELKMQKAKKQRIIADSENAYKRSYKKYNKKNIKSKKAYMIQGEELEKGKIAINHFNMDLKAIKECTKNEESSISMYLISMLAYSIYETNYKMNKGKKPINICVPINLKKYIKSETVSNFFSYMTVTLNFKKNQIYSFNKILEMVKKEFEKKLKIEKIIKTISSDAGSTNNIFIRIIPLVIKRLVVRLGSLEVKKHFTISFSNIGKIDIDKKYKKYVKNFLVILSPDWAEKVKCGVCSYEEKLVVSFSSILKNNLIEDKFKQLLKKNNISYNIEGNGVNNVSN